MTIKEVSEKYNISQDTLRYYERVGMIPQVHRTGGGSTIPDRLQLLLDQKVALEAQMADTQRMLDKLEYKISRYQVAVKTGKLTWD